MVMLEVSPLKVDPRVEVDELLKQTDPVIAEALSKAMDGKDLSTKEVLELFGAKGLDFMASIIVADKLRKKEVGNGVSFVVNRNINFTNVCTVRCGFCAFSRTPTDSDAYILPLGKIVEKAEEAWVKGATEVCIQGGIHPRLDPAFYIDICRGIKAKLPNMHVHAFSPLEVFHGANRAGVSVKDFLIMLKEAGLDSMPGTAAEILNDNVRRILCPAKIDSQTWIDIIRTAHKLGIPTTSTMMYGHVDTPVHWCEHMILLRELQRETGGFTEFIPLKFVHYHTRIYKEGKARASTTVEEDLKIHVVARLLLGKYIKNVQASWVKLGPRLAQSCLSAGANDLGGTLMEENISRAAGARHGQRMSVSEMVKLIRGIGRVPVQRTTTYEVFRVFYSLTSTYSSRGALV